MRLPNLWFGRNNSKKGGQGQHRHKKRIRVPYPAQNRVWKLHPRDKQVSLQGSLSLLPLIKPGVMWPHELDPTRYSLRSCRQLTPSKTGVSSTSTMLLKVTAFGFAKTATRISELSNSSRPLTWHIPRAEKVSNLVLRIFEGDSGASHDWANVICPRHRNFHYDRH